MARLHDESLIDLACMYVNILQQDGCELVTSYHEVSLFLIGV